MELIQLKKKILESIKPYVVKKYNKEIQTALDSCFVNIEIKELVDGNPMSNIDALNMFISAKRIEGCSERSLRYYMAVLKAMFKTVTKNYLVIDTEDIRNYLSRYRESNNISKITIDNVRRVVSTFFTWLESEDYITKSPTRRIHKVRTGKTVKDTYSDEMLERIRNEAKTIRDRAIIDFMFSTGVRVGELINLNKDEINFECKECVVLGKGNKQRKVYFDAKTKMEIIEYLNTRNDDNNALFVSLNYPYNRLQISGVEIMLRKIGQKVHCIVHPHKFRRTLATKAIDKGMPIEQVQKMLGHQKIDTTLEYAMVDENNVKISHRKYLE